MSLYQNDQSIPIFIALWCPMKWPQQKNVWKLTVTMVHHVFIQSVQKAEEIACWSLTAQYYLINISVTRTHNNKLESCLLAGLSWALGCKMPMRTISCHSSLCWPSIIQRLYVHSSPVNLIATWFPFQNYTYSCTDEYECKKGKQRRIAAVIWLEKTVTTIVIRLRNVCTM